MLQNAYFLAKIGADTAENELNFAQFLPKICNYPTRRREVLHGDDPVAVQVHREERLLDRPEALVELVHLLSRLEIRDAYKVKGRVLLPKFGGRVLGCISI